MNRVAAKSGDETLLEMSPAVSYSEDNNGFRSPSLHSRGSPHDEHTEFPLTSAASCESLCSSQNSVLLSEHSDSPVPEPPSIDRINTMKGFWRKRALFLKHRSRVDKHQQSKDSIFFRDGVRRIDFVLSYVIEEKDGDRKQERRKEFEANMEKAGLELELEDKSESDDGRTYFLKIHAPWQALATYADVLKIKAPFKANDIPDNREVPMGWLFRPFRLPDHIMNPEPDYFTAPYNNSKEDFFLIDNKETFFSPAIRNRIVYYIMSRCPYSKEDRDKDKKGIKRLLNNGTYLSAFPLHDSSYTKRSRDPNCESERYELYKYWARFFCFFKEQPINRIR